MMLRPHVGAGKLDLQVNICFLVAVGVAGEEVYT